METTDPTIIERNRRLIFFLDEMMKPHRDRHADVRAITDPDTRFNMCSIYVGKRQRSGLMHVASVHIVGMAALDPWFNEQGLRPSLITHPVDYPTLDVCGVCLTIPGNLTHRVHIDDVRLSNFFGYRPQDWIELIDPTEYQAEYSRVGSLVRPYMVRERIMKLMFPNEVYTRPTSIQVITEALRAVEPVQRAMTGAGT